MACLTEANIKHQDTVAAGAKYLFLPKIPIPFDKEMKSDLFGIHTVDNGDCVPKLDTMRTRCVGLKGKTFKETAPTLEMLGR
jgi:hypothetical protein